LGTGGRLILPLYRREDETGHAGDILRSRRRRGLLHSRR
jgi:hypothetical protein